MYFNTPEEIATSSFQEYPLSRGQAALWFLCKAAPASVSYNLAGAVVLSRDTDLEALRRAFEKLAGRHPMLRTTFAARHGEPAQRVHPSIDVAFQCKDASGWSTAQLDDGLASEVYRPFDLEHGPTWRVIVLQRAPISVGADTDGGARDDLLLLTLHHIIGDLWSMAIVLSEVMALYREGTTGAPASLRPLRATYADHVKKELGRLQGPQAELSWDYWRTVLSGELLTLSLPTDRPRPSVSTGRGAAQSVLLDQELTEGLRALAEEHHAALHTVLLTAFQILLYRYTSQDHILVGFPKAGRSPATARVVGYFVNQTVVRADFRENPRFMDLLTQVHQSVREGTSHDWYPFSLLVQHLQPTRDLSRSPLIQAVFSWQQVPRLIPRENAGAFVLGQAGGAMELGGLFLRSVPLPCRAAPFDLTMLAAEVSDGLAVTIEYATDLFDAATIARMAEGYRVLLQSIVAAPERRASDLTILSGPEREQLVGAWNATAASYPAQACLHQLFEQQVQCTPQMVAIASGEEQLTYRQLNQRANQLAHFLQEQGIGPDRLVGVCLEPSVQMVTALLGILKAGGAYLTLDPNFPEKRLAFMLADACPALVFTCQGLRSRLQDFTGPLVCLDTDEDHLRSQPQTNPLSLATPDHLAYVMYTSGSTGQPKGAALAHRGVVNLLADFQKHQPIQPGEACSWWTSPSFDVSVYEIFSPLLAGGSLQVIPEDLRLDAPRLLDWLQGHHINSAYLPPFLLEDLNAWVQRHPGVSPLRRLLVGVEPIPEALLASLRTQLPALCILNGYGPTETTICSTLYVVDAAPPHPRNTPIGRPVANTQIYLLDHALRPVPLGVVGELYIGGVGLARGYLNRPELTAQRFIPSPFRPGERLYRTGDLARYLPDGNLMFVGRRDTQVKLHGVRIELGEIEAALIQHPLIKQAAVLLHESAFSSKHLVAYVTPSQSTPPSSKELWQYLRQILPQAMVPPAIVVLDAFPLTPTGKVDRKALPAPQDLQSKGGSAYSPPRTNTEQILASIWQQVLAVERVGIDDNFFELGGDSIMSLQIVARAAEAGLHLRLQHVFQAPTVAGLAALADAATRGPSGDQRSHVRPPRKQWVEDTIDDVIPLTPIQRWFFEQNLANPHHWNQSLMLIAPQPLDPIHLRSALSDLLMRHDALRLRYTHGPFGWEQTHTNSDQQVPFEVVDLSALTQAQQADAIEAHAATQQRSLNLSHGPLIRATYFVLGADRPGRLLVVVHHLVVDGISWRILLEDLERSYRQHERGMPRTQHAPMFSGAKRRTPWGTSDQLPAKTTPFTVWARRLSDLAQSPELIEEASFWLCTPWTDLPVLPIDLLPPSHDLDDLNTEAAAESVSASLNREKTWALLREVPTAYGSQLNDLLLTALARTFQDWTGACTLWVDLEGHGREDICEDIDLTRTVGWFTTLYPVRLDLPADAEDADVRPGQAVEAIKGQLRRIPRHGLGYGLLRYLCPDPALRDRLRAIPRAPVSFNYLGRLPQAQVDGIFSGLASDPLGRQRCPDAQRSHLIEINAAISQGELHVEWTYSSRVHLRRTMERVAERYIDELCALIAHCRSQEAIGPVPSDADRVGRTPRRTGRPTSEEPPSASDPDVGPSQAELDTIVEIASRSKLCTSKRTPEAIYPLSPMQQGMVLHTLYAPESGTYLQQTTFILQGPFDVSAFRVAWQRVLERHSVLRTSFAWEGLDRMLQVVHKDVKLPLRFEDWRDISLAEQRVRLDNLLISERDRGFDLSVPPLLRLAILQTADATYRIVFNHHHALLDGWSMPLLFQEVFAYYDALTHHRDLTLPPTRPYRDYVTWLQARDLAIAEAFWRRELKGFVPVAWRLIPRLPSPPTGAFRPVEQNDHISVHTTSALKALARQQHLTINTFVQGAWAVLLSQYLRRDEVLFGIVVAGRPAALRGAETMLGLFINTLPLRVRVSPQSRLLEWLQHIQAKAIEIQQYDYTPLAKIQAWSDVPRGSPIFDTILAFENYPNHPGVGGQLGGLEISDVHSIEQSAYPLTVAVTPGQQLSLRILYDPAYFEPAAVGRLLDHLRQLLERMVVDPNQRLLALSPFTRSERDQAFESWGAKVESHSAGTSHTLLSGQQGGRVSEQGDVTQDKGPASPRNPLQEHLVQRWEKLLKTDRVGIHDNFFELGGDSLIGAICIHQLRDALRETISLAAIFEAPTVFELATYLEQKHPAGVAHLLGTPVPVLTDVEEAVCPECLVPIQPGGSRPPLFCIHPAGGVVFPYYTLAAYLGQDQPLYGVQDLSLYDDQATPKSIEAMAAGYLEVLKTVQRQGPYHLLGWSAGGMVAYEMAQQLSQQGQSIAFLALLDTTAPPLAKSLRPQLSPKDRPQPLAPWVRALSSRIQGLGSVVLPIASYVRSGLFLMTASAKRNGTQSEKPPPVIDLLGWAGLDTWRARLLREAEVAGAVSQDASLLLVEMPAVRRILGLVREHRRLARRYVARPYPGRIILFRAVPSETDREIDHDPTMGWGLFAQNGVEVHTLRANHVALLARPHVESLARGLQACLERSRSSSAGSTDVRRQ